MQTGKWQLIRVTLFTRTRARILNRIYILFQSGTWRIYSNICLFAKFSQCNKEINLITYKVNRINLMINAETKHKNVSRISETFNMAVID